MCGIAGGWWANASCLEKNFSEALWSLRRRGPCNSDHILYPIDRGTLGLGHTRLSIIDLTTAGHQPMHSPDGNASIVFNGEIYNYRELRNELSSYGHTFTSNSDTEVLLAAWRQWGRSCLTRLVGMFAFAVYEKRSEKLTCVRDAFGIKPFFYTSTPESFAFASEISAVKALNGRRMGLDLQRAYDYLVHNDYDSNTRTFVDGILQLEPGHLLEFDLSSGALASPERWWLPYVTERTDLSFDQAAERFREEFLESIRIHLRSDVPLGAALSGGLDSSAVVCAMRYVEPDLPINTFSYIAKGSLLSEERWVDHINQYVGAMAHKVTVSQDELASDLDDMIRTQGEPFGSTSIYAQYRVFRSAMENGVTVTLDGQGADEMLAGYEGYPGHRVRSMLERGEYERALRFLASWAQWPGRSWKMGIKQVIGEIAPDYLYEGLRKLKGSSGTPRWINAEYLAEQGVLTKYPRQQANGSIVGRRLAGELALALTKKGLPALLRHGDRNSMRFSVESRVPFLIPELAQFLLSLPEEYLISPQGETKRLLRVALRGIVPDAILDRRDKIGFATPERQWMLPMADTIRSWLSEDLELPFLDQVQLRNAFDSIVAGRLPYTPQVWRWINFCRWYSLSLHS
ncbi:asparagine synthase (glutamine-hydrolyzing) [Metapseudomonas otitidis]|uniref:asparagine synthase (glutamine-hydrolyzing) n=1 Tax=Metapseudomonas otitidis TaxID=319939 RepID=UPI003EE0AF3E